MCPDFGVQFTRQELFVYKNVDREDFWHINIKLLRPLQNFSTIMR